MKDIEYMALDYNELMVQALEDWLAIQDRNKLDTPYVIETNGKSYTLNEIVQAVKSNTEVGHKFVKDVIMLTLDLILRSKRKINN